MQLENIGGETITARAELQECGQKSTGAEEWPGSTPAGNTVAGRWPAMGLATDFAAVTRDTWGIGRVWPTRCVQGIVIQAVVPKRLCSPRATRHPPCGPRAPFQRKNIPELMWIVRFKTSARAWGTGWPEGYQETVVAAAGAYSWSLV